MPTGLCRIGLLKVVKLSLPLIIHHNLPENTKNHKPKTNEASLLHCKTTSKQADKEQWQPLSEIYQQKNHHQTTCFLLFLLAHISLSTPNQAPPLFLCLWPQGRRAFWYNSLTPKKRHLSVELSNKEKLPDRRNDSNQQVSKNYKQNQAVRKSITITKTTKIV